MSELPASAFRKTVQIERRGALDIAKRVLQNCGQIMRSAVGNDLAPQGAVKRARAVLGRADHA
jgi:hypothetical protein